METVIILWTFQFLNSVPISKCTAHIVMHSTYHSVSGMTRKEFKMKCFSSKFRNRWAICDTKLLNKTEISFIITLNGIKNVWHNIVITIFVSLIHRQNILKYNNEMNITLKAYVMSYVMPYVMLSINRWKSTPNKKQKKCIEKMFIYLYF